MLQHVAQIGYVEVRILLHARPDDNAAESDEEIDRRFRFEIADAVADERGLPVRSRAHVAHDELLSAGTGEEGAAIEVFVVAVVVERQRHRVYVAFSDMQRVRERQDRLLDTSRNEMNDDSFLLQRRTQRT